MNDLTRYWVHENGIDKKPDEGERIGDGWKEMVLASDFDALRQQLEQAQGELHEYKESWHKRIQTEINHVRESLKIHRVIARGEKYDEVLMMIEGGDANTIVVAHPKEKLLDRAEHAEAELAKAHQALGMLTTLVPDMEMDAEHPLEMAGRIVAKFQNLQARVDTAKNVEALLNDTIIALRKELHEAQAAQPQSSSQITQEESPAATTTDSGHRKGKEGDAGVSTQGNHDLKTHLAAAEARVPIKEF